MKPGLWLAALLAVAGCKQKDEQAPAPDPVDEVPEADAAPESVSVTWPAGDADRGKKVFTDNKCFSCHMVLLDDELMALHDKAQKDMADMDHGHDMHAGHNKPPPLNAATLDKPPLVLVKQIVIPGDDKADHHAHFGTYGDALTLQNVSDLVSYFQKVSKTLDKPETMLAEDLDLLWPAGDAAAGKALIAERCNMCHGEGSPKLEVTAAPRLVTVWHIASAKEHEPMLDKLTVRQVADLVEALTSSQ